MRPIFTGRKMRLVSAGALALPATAAALTVGPLSSSIGGANAARANDASAVTRWDAPAFSPAQARPPLRTSDRHQAAGPKADPPAPAAGWRWPWSCIAQHESGGNPAENTGNGFYGGLQFTTSTWLAYGGSGNPADASIAAQEAVAQRVLAAQGWGAWPNTSRMCGL